MWICCGKVTGIEVQLNEGGLTQYEFRSVNIERRMWLAAHLITPAGYLGSAIWGCAILICSADPTGMEVSRGAQYSHRRHINVRMRRFVSQQGPIGHR